MSFKTHLLLPLASCLLLISCGGGENAGQGTNTGFGTTTQLDTSFSDDGKTTTPFASASGNAVSLQADGKIVVAGGINQDFGLVRYNNDGSIDTSFGAVTRSNGIVTTNWSHVDDIAAMVQDTQGRFVVAGYSQVSGVVRFSVARYTAGGTPDHDFGDLGWTSLQPKTGDESSINAIAVQSTGKLVVGGYSGNTTTGPRFALARLNTTGTVDTGFGNVGSMVFDLGGNSTVYALGVQADDKILALGTDGNACVLARFIANGTQFDATFGPTGTRLNATAGTVVVPFGGSDCEARSIFVQADGKTVVAGYTTLGSTTRFAIARYDATGKLDDAFGDHGVTTVDMGSQAEAYAMAVQADGKFVLAGQAERNFALVRFNANGTLDGSFATAGKALISFGTATTTVRSSARALAIQPNGDIVVAGNAGNQFAVARYKP